MKEKDRIIIEYLNDILDPIVNIKKFLKDIDWPTFKEDIKFQYAIIRVLEIIGEGLKKNSKEDKENNSWIPWRFMAGMCDKLIHDYFGVDTDVVWNTVAEDILRLEKDIKILFRLFKLSFKHVSHTNQAEFATHRSICNFEVLRHGKLS